MPPRTRALIAAAILAGAPLASATVGEGRDTQLTALLDALGTDDFHARDRATGQIIQLLKDLRTARSPEVWQQMEQRLVALAIDPERPLETRLRILSALRQQFFETPRAAIGMTYNPLPEVPFGLSIQNLVPGFPAAEQNLLQVGDVVERIDGVTMTATQNITLLMRALICSRDPGESVSVLVRRTPRGADEPVRLNIEIPLGSFADLPQAAPGPGLPPHELEGAWQARIHRLGVARPLQTSVLDGVTLTPEQWLKHQKPRAAPTARLALAEAKPGARENVALRVRVTDANALVEAAARGEIMELERFRRQIRGPDGRVQPIEVFIRNRADEDDEADPQRLQVLERQLKLRSATLEGLNKRLNHPGITAEEKMRISAMIRAEVSAINMINLEINDLTGPHPVAPEQP